nr:hypothetical protein CFP56_22377 [Quercus suber]
MLDQMANMPLFVSDEQMFQALVGEKQALLPSFPGSTGLQACNLETQQIQRFPLDVFIPQSIAGTSNQAGCAQSSILGNTDRG